VRGLSRSDKITIMEDGVLAAPAAYAAPSAYYFPTIGRMQSVEVLKGTSAIMYGPRTTGGVLNLVSRAIPNEDMAGALDLAVGEDGFGKFHGYVGGETDTFGTLVEYYRYQADGFKNLPIRQDTGFVKNDLMTKFRINTDRNAMFYQELELKLKYSDETSDETYLGLTDEDFAADPYRRYAASQEDQMNTEHKQVQLNHYIQLAGGIEVNSSIYRNDFWRNWYKTGLDAQIASDFEKGLLGDTLDFTVKANNRNYLSSGIQSQLRVDLADHTITSGIRYHKDEMDRFQWKDGYSMDTDYVTTQTSFGIPGTDSNRIDSGEALAVFIHDEIFLGDLVINTGLRYENMTIERKDWGKNDPGRDDPPSKQVKNKVDILVPALGATYKLNEEWILLAGVQRGFAPPAAGNAEAEEELSWNYEAGFRFRNDQFNAEAVAFYGDYENMHGNCTAAQGCDEDNIGDQFNAGEVKVGGLELLTGYSIITESLSIPLSLTYTYTTTEFQRSFEADFDAWGDVSAGDELPYVPAHQLRLGIGFERNNWDANLSIRYQSEMRSKAGQGAIPPEELIDSFTVVDLAVSYQISAAHSIYLSVDNLLDREYAATRTHNSLQPGKPQTFILGYRYGF
jgi:Fe(3+) dicitrate transport protein